MASRARTARRPHLLIALGVVALVGGLWYVAPEFLHTVEFNLYDEHFRLRGRRVPNPQVAIVTIDEASLVAVGHWPWSRTVLADLVRRLDEGGRRGHRLRRAPRTSRSAAAEREFGDRLRQRLGARGLDAAAAAELEQRGRRGRS